MVLSWVVSLLGGADTTTFRYWILYLVNLVLSVWVSAGFAKILLNAYDGEEPSFSVFGELLPKLGGLIGVNFMVAVCYCIPLVLGFIVLSIGAGASAVSFNLADPYSFGHFMGQAFGGVTGILFWCCCWCLFILLCGLCSPFMLMSKILLSGLWVRFVKAGR